MSNEPTSYNVGVKKPLAARVFHACHLTGEFKLRSGAMSHEYFDKYLLESEPELLREITAQMKPLLPTEGVDALAGLEMGGIPLATMLSQHCGVPTLFVRKEAKAYGTCRLAEGGDLAGKHLVIIEDVVTSGGQILLSAKDLREAGAIVDTVLCVIDREAGGVEKLKEAGLELRALFTMSQLNEAAGVS
jgi:orotate phosphoribosyltransferase